MYNVTAAWKTALQNEETIQHIKGVITDKNGTETQIQDEIADNSVRIEHYATADADSFAVGQLYTGTVELTLLDMTTLRRDDLKGGKVSLSFGVKVGTDTSPTWIPLGVWNITDPQRGDENSIIIKGEDNTSKLDVNIDDLTTSNISWKSHMNMVTKLTGVQFAQTAEQIGELFEVNLTNYSVFSTTFATTCRAEVSAMASFLGAIAYIDRTGAIAFRKYGDNIGTATTELTIPAAKRFSADLGEYSVRTAQVCRTNARNQTYITDSASGTAANTELIVDVTGNMFLDFIQSEEVELSKLERIRDNLCCGVWIPGEIEYYGDPTIDLGDLITLSGGVNGSGGTCQYLVTGIIWQFRGPQTLISAGAGNTENVVTGSSGSAGGSSSGGAAIIQQVKTGAADLDFYRSEFTSLVEIGEVMIATSEDTIGIVQITVQIQGTANAENEFRILRDGIMQTTCSCDTTANAQKRTVSLTAVLDFTAGIHIISIEAKGSASILRAIGTVYGQGIQEYTGNPTFDSDYTYLLGELNTYIGSDTMPRIPSQLGGNDVEIIDNGAFEGKAIKYANIPDGTEEVK